MMAEGIIRRCCAKTALPVPMFNDSRTEYHGFRTVDGDETEHLFVRCTHYYMEAGRT